MCAFSAKYTVWLATQHHIWVTAIWHRYVIVLVIVKVKLCLIVFESHMLLYTVLEGVLYSLHSTMAQWTRVACMHGWGNGILRIIMVPLWWNQQLRMTGSHVTIILYHIFHCLLGQFWWPLYYGWIMIRMRGWLTHCTLWILLAHLVLLDVDSSSITSQQNWIMWSSRQKKWISRV